MKKVILITLALSLLVLVLTGCGNRDWIDTNKTYDRAIIAMPDGTALEVDIEQWRDYDGEQIQIIAEDGTVYLTSSFNCILIRNAD